MANKQLRCSKTLRIGGTSAALDNINGNNLQDGEMAFVHTADNIIYPYIEDHDNGGAENDPWLIPPDTNPGSICHVLQTIYPFVREADYDLYIKQEYEDADLYFEVNDGGVTKTPLWIDSSENEVILDGYVRKLTPFITSLADGATVTIVTAKTGYGFVNFNNGTAQAFFDFAADGTFSILFNKNDQIKSADTAGYYCLYQDGTSVKAKNNTGSAKDVNHFYIGA